MTNVLVSIQPTAVIGFGEIFALKADYPPCGSLGARRLTGENEREG